MSAPVLINGRTEATARVSPVVGDGWRYGPYLYRVCGFLPSGLPILDGITSQGTRWRSAFTVYPGDTTGRERDDAVNLLSTSRNAEYAGDPLEQEWSEIWRTEDADLRCAALVRYFPDLHRDYGAAKIGDLISRLPDGVALTIDDVATVLMATRPIASAITSERDAFRNRWRSVWDPAEPWIANL